MITGTGKILVMDDEKPVREIAGEMLTHLGYTVEYASDGKEAIEKYKSARASVRPFDAVMIDLTIPGGMGGKEAHDRLVEIDPGVRTIVASGYSSDPVMSQHESYGFKGGLIKPFDVEELGQTLHRVLNNSEIAEQSGTKH